MPSTIAIAIVSKQPKNYMCALSLWCFTGSQASQMYLECTSHPKLNHDNIIEALMMA